MKQFVGSLIEKGLVCFNRKSPWASAPFLVSKPGPAKFRFTVDLRAVNKFTVEHQYPMPNLEYELSKLAHARHYATFDLSHGYLQIPLEKESQNTNSFLTLDGVYTLARVLHATTNVYLTRRRP